MTFVRWRSGEEARFPSWRVRVRIPAVPAWDLVLELDGARLSIFPEVGGRDQCRSERQAALYREDDMPIKRLGLVAWADTPYGGSVGSQDFPTRPLLFFFNLLKLNC